MWLGQLQLGTYLDVVFQSKDAGGVPTEPTTVPALQVRRASDNAVVYSARMPISDRAHWTFCLPLFLGQGFTSGSHTLRVACTVDGVPGVDVWSFAVIPGGSQRGQGLSATYYHRPSADYIVYQGESGVLLRGKNPSIP